MNGVMPRMPSNRLLLIDDHALFRLGMHMVLKEGLANAEVLEADSIGQGLLICEEPPAVVLLDIHLRGLNGMEGLGLLASRWPGVPVIMLSSQSEPEIVRLAMERGAVSFVSKAEPTQQILEAVRNVLAEVGAGAGDRTKSPVHGRGLPLKSRLTPRQCEILDLLCEGLSNKEIARRIAISEFTVRGHVQALLGLLNVSNRTQATIAARSSGLLG